MLVDFGMCVVVGAPGVGTATLTRGGWTAVTFSADAAPPESGSCCLLLQKRNIFY